jgi:2-aminoethylphosphonate aminotransferase
VSDPVRRILLNPGPATTSLAVKRALVIPDVCPRETELCDLFADVRRRLAALAGDPAEIAAVPVVGSGTAALEAALVSFVPPDGRLVVLDNGDYGERLVQIARTHALPLEVVSAGWGQPFDLAALDVTLSALGGGATHLAFVHHETSTGMLNPLPEIAALARRHGLRTIVDAMSSFAALPMRVSAAAGGVDALVSSANKCLQGMAGLAFVIGTRAVFDAGRAFPPRSLYLNLSAELAHLEKTGQSRFTVPPQVLSALRQALVETEAEGIGGRGARYARSMAALMAGLRELGLSFLLEDRHQSGILVAIREPDAPWYDFGRMHDALYAEGFTIYPGKAGRTPTFRLSVLGDIDERDILAFLAALRGHFERARAASEHR